MLCQAIRDMLTTQPADEQFVRVVAPSQPGDPYYAFIQFPHPPDWSEELYRQRRQDMLIAYCKVLKAERRTALDIIGIAFEPRQPDGGSEDVLYLDGRTWSERDQEEAKEIQRRTGFFTQARAWRSTHFEYPDPTAPRPPVPGEPITVKGRGRNLPCPCGSEKKYKHCCGKVRRGL